MMFYKQSQQVLAIAKGSISEMQSKLASKDCTTELG